MECTHGYPFDPAMCRVCRRKAVPDPGPKTCKNGHPYEGNRRQKKNGTSCILCDRVQDRARQAAKRRAGGRMTKSENIARMVEANKVRAEAARRKRDAEARDGFEDYYGPAPARVPNSEWYDEVIVIRALNHQRTGRKPYPLEWQEIFRRESRWEGITNETLSEATGANQDTITRLRGAYVE